MSDVAKETIFQNDMITQLKSNGWVVGNSTEYNRALALYSPDLLSYVKTTQASMWDKYCELYSSDSNSSSKDIRAYGTLGILRKDNKDRGTLFSLCQFKPEGVV